MYRKYTGEKMDNINNPINTDNVNCNKVIVLDVNFTDS